MIVRILTEGQYELADKYLTKLNELDNRLVGQVTTGADSEFEGTFEELLELVRSDGRRLSDQELVPSDVVIPAPDATFAELRQLFVDEGLTPN